jgi:hypothetical protein
MRRARATLSASFAARSAVSRRIAWRYSSRSGSGAGFLRSQRRGGTEFCSRKDAKTPRTRRSRVDRFTRRHDDTKRSHAAAGAGTPSSCLRVNQLEPLRGRRALFASLREQTFAEGGNGQMPRRKTNGAGIAADPTLTGGGFPKERFTPGVSRANPEACGAMSPGARAGAGSVGGEVTIRRSTLAARRFRDRSSCLASRAALQARRPAIPRNRAGSSGLADCAPSRFQRSGN